MSAEKLCLQWNDFQENVKAAFGSLRGDVDFADVTLACEDGHQIEAHRVVLAASSPFFQSLLKRNKHSHSIIFMRGMKSEDLDAIVNFLYYGEANVYQESLDSFLAIAEELKLKGLVGQANANHVNPHSTNFLNSVTADSKQFKRPAQDIPSNGMSNDNLVTKEETTDFETCTPPQNNAVALPLTSGELEELEEKVKSMMEKSPNMIMAGTKRRTAFICKVCGKEGQDTDIKRHIEAIHLEGISIPCNLCDKTCRSRLGLIKHTTRFHKKPY